VTDESRLHEMIADACLGATSEELFTRDLRGFLETHGVSSSDAEAILASPPRLALYRRLVRNNLTGVTGRVLGRTRARFEDAAPGRFDASFDEFLADVGPRTHYLRDVPGEFLAWAAPRWTASPELPRFFADFARHELAHFEVATAEITVPAPRVTEIAPDRALAVAEHVRLARYGFAVHELPVDPGDRTVPPERPVNVLLYRDEDDEARALEIGAFAAAIVRAVMRGAALADAVREAAAEAGPLATGLDVAAFLADLAERRIILGGRT
jgi:hypothetical protein